jgi:hypothetical protein
MLVALNIPTTRCCMEIACLVFALEILVICGVLQRDTRVVAGYETPEERIVCRGVHPPRKRVCKAGPCTSGAHGERCEVRVDACVI